MNRRDVTAALGALSWPMLSTAAANESEAAAGIRATLERGALAAVSQLGRADGFLGNPQVRIPLPGLLEDAGRLLKATGQGRRVDELVTAMNRAAEAAVPEARTLFVEAARAISIEDALRIVRGGATSVTDFFDGKTRSRLADRFLPIVTRATMKVDLAERYNRVAAKVTALGLLKGDQASIEQHVTGGALDGLFLMIGEEEKKIRADPVRTGSALLRKVFSN